MVDIKTQGLTIFVFILPLSVCHSLKRAKKKFLFYFLYILLLHYYFIFLEQDYCNFCHVQVQHFLGQKALGCRGGVGGGGAFNCSITIFFVCVA